MARQRSSRSRRRRSKGLWIQEAVERQKAKGTVGAFGRATRKKITAGKRKGGLQRKRAIFAENLKKINARRFGRRQVARS
jgi:hypothetical protein